MKCEVSLAPSGNIQLEIPSVLAAGRSHCVEIPLTMNGLSLLKKVLLDRQQSPVTPTIGMMASPVASQVHAFMVKKESADRAAAKTTSDALQSKFNITLDL